MSTRLKFFSTGAFIFLLFVFFSFLVHKDIFRAFDFDTTIKLQDRIPRRFDEWFSIVSMIGNFEVLTILLVILLFLRRKIRGILLLFSYIALHLFELYGKFFVQHTPPPEFLLRVQKPFNFPQFHVRAENSFPSGHAGRSTFLSVVLLFLVWKSKKLSGAQKIIVTFCIVLFDLLMYISRPYLGEHWTSDVIGGMLLGFGLALMTEAFL